MANTTGASVSARFSEETEHIADYIDVTTKFTKIEDKAIREVNVSLRRQGIPEIPKRCQDRYGKPFSVDEIKTLLQAFDDVEGQVTGALEVLDRKLDPLLAEWQMDIPKGDEYLFTRAVDIYEEDFHVDFDRQIDQAVIDHVYRVTKGNVDLEDDDTDEQRKHHEKQIIDRAVRSVEWDRRNVLRINLRSVLRAFDEMRITSRTQLPDSVTNTHRQAFLLLMTVFDAAIFDIARCALRNSFFHLISKIGRTDKVPLKDFANFDDFEHFRDHMIEGQLKTLYAKDLLLAVTKLGVQIGPSQDDDLIEIVELILRRNVHVHNRGVIDERYLERDDKGSPKYNLKGLAVGDVAVIDEVYFQRAKILSSECVRRLAGWADTLLASPP